MNKKIVLLVLSIFLVITVFASTTYSVLFKTDYTEEQSYTTGTLNITSNAINDSVTLTNSLPVSDTEGRVGSAYVFKIENVGNLSYNFDIKLLSTNSDTSTMIDANYIKVMVNSGNPVTLASLTDGIILSNRTLAPTESLQVTLRVWLDENTPNTQIGKTFTAKITTTGQAIYSTVITTDGRDGTETGNTRTSLQMISTLGLSNSLKSGTPDFTKTAPYEVAGTVTGYTESTSTTSSTFSDPTSLVYSRFRYCYYDSYNFNSSTGKFTLIGSHNTNTLGTKNDPLDLEGKYASNNSMYYNNSNNNCASSVTNLSSIYEIQSAECVNNSCYGSSSSSSSMSKKINEKNKVDFMVVGGEVIIDAYATIITKQISAVANSSAPTLNTTETGIYQATDDLGTSYYFRGNVTNNYVKFGKNSSNNDMYWRIIRINGDGSVRMIYEGTSAYDNGILTGSSATDRYGIGTSSFNTSSSSSSIGTVIDDNAYVGFMYGEVGSTTYLYTHANVNSSTIKSYLEDWYLDNIEDTGYSNYLSDAIYCNDRSLSSGDGISTNATVYSGASTSLICSQSNDKFSYYTAIGNGLLAYKIGLITASEVRLAGGVLDSSSVTNKHYYLYNGNNYWTMTPSKYNISSTIYGVNSNGNLYGNATINTYYVRPVISLKSGLTYSGSGTKTSPFTVS